MVCSCLYLVSYARFDIERTIMRFCLQNQMLSMEVFAQLCRVRGISDPTVYAALVASEAPVSVALLYASMPMPRLWHQLPVTMPRLWHQVRQLLERSIQYSI